MNPIELGKLAVPFPATLNAEVRCTDVGNGLRLARRHGADLRWCDPWKRWLCWDGRRWRRDDDREADRRAKDTVAAIHTEVALIEAAMPKEIEGDKENARKRSVVAKERDALIRHAVRSEDARRVVAMLEMARSELPVMADQLDCDPWALNVLNGTVDLKTGVLREHRQSDLLTKLAPVEYDPHAEAPLWRACLEEWQPDADTRSFLQRAAGYAATGDVSEEVLFFLHGAGQNGKSVFVRTLLDLLGDYGMQGAPDLLLAKSPGHIPTDQADLQGRRLVATIEVEDGRRMAEVLVKQLTGGDRVTARRMRENFFSFDPTHKLWLIANHRPVIKGTDHAIWRRIMMVPFGVTIPPEKRDRHLRRRLAEERAGILAWLVEGALAWQREGLAPPREVMAATAEYRSAMDVLGEFLKEECVEADGAAAWATELWTAYQKWSAGESGAISSQRALGVALRERGFVDKKGTAGKRRWLGLRLASDLTLDER